MRRAGPLLAVLLLLTACGVRPSAGAPGPTVHVLSEGIHSGLLLPADWLWPGATGTAEASFGDAAWMLAEDRSTLRACRLVLWPSDGAMYLKRRAPPADALAVPLSPTGARQLRAELARWLSPGPDLATWADGAVFRPAPRFHVFANCHDQVAAALRAAGVPLAGTWLPWRTTTGFRTEVQDALAALRARGIRWVENAPE